MNNKITQISSFLYEDSEPPQTKSSESDPVEAGFHWLLLLGRALGISPISVPIRSKSKNYKFRWRSFSTLHSFTLTLTLLIVFIPELWTCVSKLGHRPSILAEMEGMEDTIYRFSVAAMCTYFLWNAAGIINLLEEWSTKVRKLDLKEMDNAFPKFCFRIVLIILGMCGAENILYTMYRFQREEGNVVERIYKSVLGNFAELLPHYSIATSIPLVYAVTAGVYCWHFADIFLIAMCRALTHKFDQINEEFQSVLCKLKRDESLNFELKPNKQRPSLNLNQSFKLFDIELSSGIGVQKGEREWREIREKVTTLCCLAEEVTAFFPPIVLSAYVYNIFLVILNIIRFIYQSDVLTGYVYVSTLEYALRVVLVTYYSSQLYHSTEKILKTLERYPDSVLSPMACGLERMLARHPVGVTIFETVTICRSTFISILTFLFTAEIVLLQAMSASNSRSQQMQSV